MRKPDRRTRVTWVIPPPAESITPAIAKDWLYRVYPALSAFAELGGYPTLLRGRREEKKRLEQSLRGIGMDVRRITEACGKAMATGRPVAIHYRPRYLGLLPLRQCPTYRNLRAVVWYEQRRPHRGVRGLLSAALLARERLEREHRE